MEGDRSYGAPGHTGLKSLETLQRNVKHKRYLRAGAACYRGAIGRLLLRRLFTISEEEHYCYHFTSDLSPEVIGLVNF